MKTPRAVLFERHGSANAKLDRIRRTVLERIENSGRLDACSTTWQVFLLSIRWHLAGLGAAWLIVMLLNIDHLSDAPPIQSQTQMPSARQLLAAARENRRQVQELSGAGVVESDAPLHGPHSSIHVPLCPWEQCRFTMHGHERTQTKAAFSA